MLENLDRCIASFCEGDNQSIIPLYKGWSKEFYFVAYKYLRNHEEAQDLVSDVFEKLLSMPPKKRHRKFIEQGIDIKALLLLVVKNKALDRIKVKDNRKRILGAIQHLLPSTSNNEALNRFSSDFVKSLLMILPERDRRIFQLTLEGYKREEIAAEFHLSQKTISNSLSSSRNKLKKMLEDFG